MEAFRKAEEALQNLLQTPSPWAFGLSWVPEEPMDQRNPNIVSGRGYGFTRVGSTLQPPPVAFALHLRQVGAGSLSANPEGKRRRRVRQSR